MIQILKPLLILLSCCFIFFTPPLFASNWLDFFINKPVKIDTNTMKLNIAIRAGDLQGVKQFLQAHQNQKKLVNQYDKQGLTPLMYAVQLSEQRIAMIDLLLNAGANITAKSKEPAYRGITALSMAVQSGDPYLVQHLIQNGADIKYINQEYNALIDAMHGRDIRYDENLIPLVQLLIRHKVSLDQKTKYGESGVRVASRLGRFDAVKLLLDSGASDHCLDWTPLMKAIAFGNQTAVVNFVSQSKDLEQRDSWKRTPWLLAIQTGSIPIAKTLLQHGANSSVLGNGDMPSLFYAIGNGHEEMLEWLIKQGMDIEQTDDFGHTPLMHAVENNELNSVNILLKHGARIDYQNNDQTALNMATSAPIAKTLLTAGADPSQLSKETKRLLSGLDTQLSEEYRTFLPEQFQQQRYHQFGKTNPEKMDNPFWIAMIRSGVSAWHATDSYNGQVAEPTLPVWCSDRFGQSINFLEDGRIIWIAGEHEDFYDPDFLIYNDVTLINPNGDITIYGYPKSVFPPTDFHSATLVDKHIYIIGRLGYQKSRRPGFTPVFKLSLENFQIEKVATKGDMPGWIYDHKAILVTEKNSETKMARIEISGGTLYTIKKGKPIYSSNKQRFVLDLKNMLWSRLD